MQADAEHVIRPLEHREVSGERRLEPRRGTLLVREPVSCCIVQVWAGYQVPAIVLRVEVMHEAFLGLELGRGKRWEVRNEPGLLP